jgi:hypothetical protein
MQNTLYFNFNFFKLAGHDELPLHLIRYDAQNKIISIPVVLDDEQVTKKFMRYQFNGVYFEKIKRGPG